MEQMPDMSFKPVQSPLALVTEQNRLKQQALENHRQKSQDDFTRIQQVSTMASNMVQSMVSAAAQRQLQQGMQTLSAPAVQPQPAMGSSVGLPTGPVGTPSSMDAQGNVSASPFIGNQGAVTTDQNNRRQATMMLAQKLAPEKFGEQMISQAFPKSEAAPKERAVQAKNVLFDGKPATLNFQNGKWFDQQMQPIGEGHTIAPVPISAPLAAVRGDALDNTMLQQQNKNLNVAFASKGSQLGTNATIATNADSALQQMDLVLSGKVKPNKQVMAVFAEDAARVLAQAGQSSENRVNNFMPQTAKSKYADWKEWVTNEPQSRDAQAFLKNIRPEIQRQRDQRSALVEQGIKQAIPAAAILRQRNLPLWTALMDSNGIDVEAAKKGIYRFKKGYSPIPMDAGETFPPEAGADDMSAFLE